MKHFAVTNLFLLAAAILASFCAANVANADSDEVRVYNNTDYVMYAVIGYTQNMTDEVVHTSGNGIWTEKYVVGEEEIIRGWYEINPHSSDTFWTGKGTFLIYLQLKKDGNTYDQKLPFKKMHAWVKSGDAFKCITRNRDDDRGGNRIVIKPIIIDGDVTFDDYLWDKISDNNYRHFFSRNVAGIGRENREGSSLNKQSYSWLENELKRNDWEYKTFYIVPSSIEYIRVGNSAVDSGLNSAVGSGLNSPVGREFKNSIKKLID